MSVLFKGADPLIAALDGQPVALRNLGTPPLVLAPGQRCDLLVSEGEDDITLALDLFEDIVEIGYLRRTGPSGQANLAENFVLPANLISTEASNEAAVQASLVIEGGAKGGMKAARLKGEVLDLRTLLEKGFAWSLNGTAGLSSDPWMNFQRGTSVTVNVENRTKFAQPLHIHGHVWRMIERDGKALDNEPWRDTAIVAAGNTAKLAFIADNPGTWGLHSTIAERIDSGLITSFAVDH
jgi:FtsP/CotA-like multicopper oxidase with cupredoxin domain